MALTAEQIRNAATAATANLGAASSQSIASDANIVKPAPNAGNTLPQASTTDAVQPAPALPGVVAPTMPLEQQVSMLQAQLAQALGVIATIRPAAVAAVQGERTYHSGVPFVKIQVMKGPGICEGFQFKGGKLTTDDPHAIAFMEATIAAGNTMFSHAPVPKIETPEEQEMKKDVIGAAIIARDKMVKAGETVA